MAPLIIVGEAWYKPWQPKGPRLALQPSLPGHAAFLPAVGAVYSQETTCK